MSVDEMGRDPAVKFFEGWFEDLEGYDPAQQLDVIRSACRYAWYGEEASFDDGHLQRVYRSMRRQMLRDWRQIQAGRRKNDRRLGFQQGVEKGVDIERKGMECKGMTSPSGSQGAAAAAPADATRRGAPKKTLRVS